MTSHLIVPSALVPAPVPSQEAVVVCAQRDAFPCRGLVIWRIAMYACATVTFLFVNSGGVVGNTVFFLVVAGMMLASPTSALMGFTCAVLALTVNTAFVVKTIAFTFSRVFSVALFSARFTLTSNLSFVSTPPYIAIVIFCLVAALCSIVSGYFTAIALIKVFIFWVGMTGFFAFASAVRQKQIDTTEWFVSQAVVVVMLSALSLALGVAQNFRGPSVTHELYNLAFYHSQTAGPIFALVMVYLTCVLLFAGHRNRWISIPLLCCLAYGLFLTRSRTGVGTLVAGISTVTVLAFAWSGGRKLLIRLNYSRKLLVAGAITAALCTIFYDVGTRGSLSTGVRSFVAKSQQDVGTLSIDEIFLSRRGLIDRSWENFQRSPVFGIGFGLSTDQQFRDTATIFYAPVEKGFLPTALLEEVGVVGAVTFLGFVTTMFASLIRARNIPGTAMFASLLALNLGEAGIFALSGHAAYMWLFVIGGILLGDRCSTAAFRDRTSVADAS